MATSITTLEQDIFLSYTTPCGVVVGTTVTAGANKAGWLARQLIGPMTACCKGAVKHDCDGVLRCKGCWSGQPDYMAGGDIEAAATAAGCSIPEECASFAWWQLSHQIDEALGEHLTY